MVPRRRMIDPEIWRNEKVGNLPDAGRLLFIGIFSQADDDGRLKASPAFLMASIFPYDKDKTVDDIGKLRNQCAELGLIRLYTNGKQEYLDIPGWLEHQQIRKDRYTRSEIPSFEDAKEILTTTGKPSGNRLATTDQPNIIKSSLVKSSLIKTPKGGSKKKLPDTRVNEIFEEMRIYLGYPDKVKEDPIPNYGKEGQAIKRMLTRGFTREEVTNCWKQKVDARGGDFISMQWVNEDIGKKGGADGKGVKDKRGKVHTREDFSGGKW